MKEFILGLILCLLSLVAPTVYVVKSIQFEQGCGSYLKNAADANTIELAIERLDVAIKYIEDHNLTDGYTSVLWKTEDENIGYWYRNIKASRDELEKNLGANSLETSNVLMRLRETLTDISSEHGTKITIPQGISRYPGNLWYGILITLSVIIFCFGFLSLGMACGIGE